MMKRTALMAGVFGLAVLAGCSKTVYMTETTPVATEAPATEAPATTKPRPKPVPTTAASYSDYDMFVTAVHVGTDQMIYLTDSELIDMGLTICASFDAGVAVEDVVDVLFESSYEYGDGMMQMFAAIAASATTFLCPEYANVWNSADL